MSDQLRSTWLRAWQRALSERLIPYQVHPTLYTVNAYLVTVTGPGWADTTCECLGALHGHPCKHRAVVAKARSLALRPGAAPVLGTVVGRA